MTNSVLPLDFLIENRQSLDPICGVYFLFSGDRLVYVGQSIDVAVRISTHATQRVIEFDSYAVHRCGKTDLRRIEAMHIAHYRPKHNIDMPRDWGSPLKRKDRAKFAAIDAAMKPSV